ncbi:uncharacterized protein M6B38_258480 [Iris pallida]|uniref:GBF-interacting protein 1 N-terminal domain-containing protein n=1 Tax=Iris pallida TaxID=29817 RepID=A0AAX6IEQ5_IRIPA|nr:uncharacterized protein M6B38_258480 [Iris pallida]
MPSVGQPCDSVAGHTKGVVPTSTSLSLQLGKTQATASTLNSQTQREGKDSSKENSSLTLSNSVVGVYSSASDPVHVPSPASRPSGTVGAIRREVGVVGVRKQSSYQPATNSAVPNSSFSVPLSAKDISSTKESFEQSVGTPKQNQVVVSDPVISNGSTSRSFSGSQHNIKVAQQSSGHQKAMQSTMEWKPKTSQKPTVISPIVSAHTRSSCAEDASSSNPADVSNLSKKLSQVNVLEEPERHVIIPQHLQVPESEYTKLTFGSFAAGFDSTKSFSSACQALEDEELCDEPSVSLSASVPVSPIENTSADDQVNMSACQARTSRSESPASAAETEQSPSGNTESLNHQDIENYADIGLVESQSPPYSSPQTQQLPTPASLPTFSAYEPRSSYGIPFFRNVAEDNIHGQGFSSSEALSLHATNNSSSSVAALTQLQPQSMQQQQQQQPVTNLYPQVHFSHFPNFVPYRHIFSPVYVPPMAIPNYSNNPAYPHPSNGSNYFLMPGGSSHIPAGGVKYAPSQYKTVPSGNPSGYGNYTNPTGFTINPPGSVGGATALEDVNRPRYKDNNLYIPNPQAETSDMWLQTPRELPGLQPASYYNLPGQQPHAAAAAAAFMPAAHGGHASFNAAAAQSSHVQYPTLYHPSPSPASLTAPHHLVHQSGIGGSIGGVGMVAAAPGSQVGAYQQPQLSHTNWPTNF